MTKFQKFIVKIFKITPEVKIKEVIVEKYVYPKKPSEPKRMNNYSNDAISKIIRGNHPNFGVNGINFYGFSEQTGYSLSHYRSDICKILSFLVGAKKCQELVEARESEITFCFLNRIDEGTFVFDLVRENKELVDHIIDKFFPFGPEEDEPEISEEGFLAIQRILDKRTDIEIKIPELSEEIIGIAEELKEKLTVESKN